jgi:hypothetical protein
MFSHDIKELSYKLLLIVIYKLCIYNVPSMFLIHMDVLCEAFLP